MKKIWYVFFILFIIPSFVYAEQDIYDVILFWGQSNMVGFCGENVCSSKSGEKSKDTRLEELGEETFSEKTGIDLDIVKRYKTMGYVEVPIEEGTVYEYVYNTNSLVSVNSKTKSVGENLYPHIVNNKVTFNNSPLKDENTISLQKSSGINMTSWFAKNYYEKTGHKVVIVMGAVNGMPITSFLPHGKKNTMTTTTNKNYIFEAMTTKYEGAIKYLESHNMKIGNRFDVIMQGEADTNGTTAEEWEQKYIYIHNTLKEKYGMQFSVLIKTSYTIKLGDYKCIKAISEAQDNAVKNNTDVILGSSYAWDRYVSTNENYSGKFMGENMSYDAALKQALLSVSISPCYNNRIHFHSATLSQIGLEASNNSVTYMRENGMLNDEYEYTEYFTSIKINGENIKINQEKNFYEIDSNINTVNVEAILANEKLKFVEGFGPRIVEINSNYTEVLLKVLMPDKSVKNYTVVILKKNDDSNLKKGFLSLKLLLYVLLILLIILLIYYRNITNKLF